MASLYVANLDPDCTEAVLYHKFAPFGNLLSIRLGRDRKTGRFLGYGYINYASNFDAEYVLSNLNYTSVQGRIIRLMKVQKDIKQLPPKANLFIKNLDTTIDERSLHDIFAIYGNIFSLKVAKDEKGLSKGFAFIQYEEEKSAEDAIKNVDKKIIWGKIVQVTKFQPKDKRSSPNIQFKNIYIKHIDSDVSDSDLYDLCKNFGEIVSAKVMLDEDGNSRQFGFVCFENPDSAKEAVKELNGKLFNGRVLFVGRAKKKLERQKEVQENFKRMLELNIVISVAP